MLETRGMSAYGLHVKSLETDEKDKPILDDKGKKKYRLHQSVISKIKNNDSKALQLDTLDMLCKLLDCQPADLMIYESTTQSASTTQNVPRATQSAKHTQNVSRATQSAKHTQNVNTTQSASDNKNLLPSADKKKAKTEKVANLPELSEGDKWLKTAEIAERLGIKAHSTVRDFYNKQGLAHTRVGMISYVKESDLNAFLANRTARGKSKP